MSGGAWRWAWNTAWRDARGSRGQASLYAFSMALGIAALVAMTSFGADLDRAVGDQTKNLVGADLTVRGNQPFSPEVEAFFDTVPGESASLMSFASMAAFPKSDQALLARVRAIEGGFPFYGELETTPADAASALHEGPAAIVDRSLMARIGAQIGDPIRLGQREFRIEAVLEAAPGEPPVASLMGPRIYIPMRYVEETGLVQRGSRVFYTRAFKLPAQVNPDALAASHKQMLREERLSVTTAASRRRELGQAMANLTRFLNLTACLALLLGGLGVAAAVHYHVKRKTRQIAALRCLGATVRQAAMVFMLQVMAISLAAATAGALLGTAIQFLTPRLVAEWLPFSFTPQIQPRAIAVGVAWGLLLSALLALAPLAGVRRISPLLSFRPELSETPGRDWAQIAIYGAAAAAWWAFAAVQLRSPWQGAAFVGALLAGVAALYAVARLLSWAARRLLSPRLPFAWRHGLASLFRPRNQTSVFLIILGMGVVLTSTLAGARSMLLGQFDAALTRNRANFIAFDIQSDQADGVAEIMAADGLAAGAPIPIVPMRLAKIKGRPVAELMDESGIPQWMLRHEYRSTYRDSLVETETLEAGAWVAESAPGQSPVPISIERDIARALGLALGDTVEMDVMGLPLALEVASLRRVDWQSMQPNFYVVFPKGALEEAPQMFIQAAKTNSAEEAARLQRDLAAAYPNVSSFDMTQVIASIDQLLGKAEAVIRFLAGLCIAAGFALLASAVWNSRYQRLGEHALLRTLGASRRQMAQITLTEYFFLGLFAALTGLILAILANWGLGRLFFEDSPFPDWRVLAPPILYLPLMTLALGYLSLRGVWRVSPRTILRRED